MNGFLLIDKEAGITSAEVIRRIKRAVNRRDLKIGHAGTLDPDATGLLIVLFGNATRLQDDVMSGLKEYQGVIRLGMQTDTDDCSGKEIARSSGAVASERFAEIEALLRTSFTGEILQRPPIYSAVKVEGERSYARARNEETIELKARPVRIEGSEFKFIDPGRIRYTIRCGSGTYIRSIARDAGPLFGEVSCAESIRRTESGGFTLEQAVPSAELTAEKIESQVHPFTELLKGWPREVVNSGEAHLIRSGDQRPLMRFRTLPRLALFEEGGAILALAEQQGGKGLRLRCVL